MKSHFGSYWRNPLQPDAEVDSCSDCDELKIGTPNLTTSNVSNLSPTCLHHGLCDFSLDLFDEITDQDTFNIEGDEQTADLKCLFFNWNKKTIAGSAIAIAIIIAVPVVFTLMGLEKVSGN